MIDARVNTRQRGASSLKDLELIAHALQEAITVIDDYDPARNPARCMRQIRRLLDDPKLRLAVERLVAEIPLLPDTVDD